MVVDHADAHGYANDFIRDIAARADCLPDDPPDVVNLRELFQGRFDIWGRVATGGQGRVYQASRVGDDSYERIAIKLLVDGPLASDQARQRFMHEIDLASRLDHPGIVPILESGEVANRYFFTMPFIYGAPIDDYALVQESSVRDRVTLIAKAARALVAAHLGGVIHRDLKPSNILVDYKTHEPYILDFGLAKELRQEAVTNDPSSISLTGQVVGTLPYFSPEQASGGSGKVDVRSDVYTLGLVLYRLLTARFPYDIDGDRDAVLHNIRHQDSMPLQKALALAFEAKRDKEPNYISDSHTINEDLNRIVRKALNKEPERRYQTMAAFADDLECYLRGGAVQAKADTAMYLLRKAVRRNKTLFVSVAVVLLFAFGGLGLTAMHYRREAKTAAIAREGLMAGSFVRMGSFNRDAGRVEDAISMFNAAMKISERSTTNDPVIVQHQYKAIHRLCELHLMSETPEAAEPHCREAVELAESMVNREPNNPEWQRLLAFSFSLRGRSMLVEGDNERAIEFFDKCIDILQGLSASGKLESEYKLGLILGYRGKSHKRLRQFDEARKDYEYGQRVIARLHAAEPENAAYELELARVEFRLALLCLHRKNHKKNLEAQARLEKAAGMFRGLIDEARAPSLAEAERQLQNVRTNQELVESRLAARR